MPDVRKARVINDCCKRFAGLTGVYQRICQGTVEIKYINVYHHFELITWINLLWAASQKWMESTEIDRSKQNFLLLLLLLLLKRTEFCNQLVEIHPNFTKIREEINYIHKKIR